MAIVCPIVEPLHFEEWVATLPKQVQAMIKSHPPDRLYRMKSTGQRVTIAAYSENGTVRVNVTAKYNFVSIERTVFGIPLDDLEECDLPPPDELVGCAGLTQEEALEIIRSQREKE